MEPRMNLNRFLWATVFADTFTAMVKITSSKKLKGKELAKMRPAMERVVARAPAHSLARKQGAPKLKMSLKDDAVVHYLAACVAPFSEEAVGCRVPGPYEVRTRTTKLLVPYQFTGASNADCIITANPMNSLYTGASGWSGGEASTNINGSLGAIMTAASESTLQGIYYQYRTVAFGIRVKCDSSYTSTSGRMFVAVVPSASILPMAVTDSNPLPNRGSLYRTLGAPIDSLSLVSASIVSFPVSMEFSLSEVLANGGVDICAPKSSPAHQNFLHLGDGSVTPDMANFNLGTGVGTHYVSFDRAFNGGQSNILVRFDGLTTTSTITVEVVYHLEGSPVPSASAFIADAEATGAVTHSSDLEEANIISNSVPSIGYKKKDLATPAGLAAVIRSAAGSVVHAGVKRAATGIIGLMA